MPCLRSPGSRLDSRHTIASCRGVFNKRPANDGAPRLVASSERSEPLLARPGGEPERLRVLPSLARRFVLDSKPQLVVAFRQTVEGQAEEVHESAVRARCDEAGRPPTNDLAATPSPQLDGCLHLRARASVPRHPTHLELAIKQT